ILLPDRVLQALGRRFAETGDPRDLTLVFPISAGDMFGQPGLDHLAQKGLPRRLIGGSYASGPSTSLPPRIVELVRANEVEAYNLPSGMLFGVHREIAAKRPGVLTEVGLGTFVDPRNSGGRMNARTTDDLLRVVELNGREWLFLPSFNVDVAIIRATTADEDGNLTMEHEPAVLGAHLLALAAHACGGRVIAQVERVAQRGT